MPDSRKTLPHQHCPRHPLMALEPVARLDDGRAWYYCCVCVGVRPANV